MSVHPILPVALLVSFLSPGAARAAVTLWTSVPVRVYEAPEDATPISQASLDLAASIVSAASVQIVWRKCDRGACDTPLRRGELAVRLVRTPVPAGYRGELPLGDALIEQRQGAGVLATVYLDRIEWMAGQTGADPRVLLGRTIAHELGHLLLATNAHGAEGLMRAVWSRSELQRRQWRDWIFKPTEIAAIKARIVAR